MTWSPLVDNRLCRLSHSLLMSHTPPSVTPVSATACTEGKRTEVERYSKYYRSIINNSIHNSNPSIFIFCNVMSKKTYIEGVTKVWPKLYYGAQVYLLPIPQYSTYTILWMF